jgi:hypothetical protein
MKPSTDTRPMKPMIQSLKSVSTIKVSVEDLANHFELSQVPFSRGEQRWKCEDSTDQRE